MGNSQKRHTHTQVAAFAGVLVGAELRRSRALGPEIAAVDWALHDEPWLLGGAEGTLSSEEEGE